MAAPIAPQQFGCIWSVLAPLMLSYDEGSDFLRDLADHLMEKEKEMEQPVRELQATGYALVLIRALDQALDVVGRTGKDVLYMMLETRLGLSREDIAYKPGPYMSGLRDLLGQSCDVIEKYMLRYVAETTGIRANTLEDAVAILKGTGKGGA